MKAAHVAQMIQTRIEELRAERHKIHEIPCDFWGDQISEQLDHIKTRIDEAQKIAALIGVEVV